MRTFDLRRFRISPVASLALSPEFVTNALLGLSRPVGKGPGGFPKKSSTTPCGAALFRWVAEANKLYAFFDCFPAEMRGCEHGFHWFHWNISARNNIILVVNEALQLRQIFGHLSLLIFHLSGVQIIPFPKLKSDHLQNR